MQLGLRLSDVMVNPAFSARQLISLSPKLNKKLLGAPGLTTRSKDATRLIEAFRLSMLDDIVPYAAITFFLAASHSSRRRHPTLLTLAKRFCAHRPHHCASLTAACLVCGQAHLTIGYRLGMLASEMTGYL